MKSKSAKLKWVIGKAEEGSELCPSYLVELSEPKKGWTRSRTCRQEAGSDGGERRAELRHHFRGPAEVGPPVSHLGRDAGQSKHTGRPGVTPRPLSWYRACQ